MNTTVWTSPNGKYKLLKDSDNSYELLIEGCGYEIYKEDGEFCSNSLCFVAIPKYVLKAINKHVGDVMY